MKLIDTLYEGGEPSIFVFGGEAKVQSNAPNFICIFFLAFVTRLIGARAQFAFVGSKYVSQAP